MGYWGLKNIETFLPIDWAEDGTTAPEAAALVTSGSGNFRARNFASDQSEDIAISWKVPVGIDTAAPITIRVNMIVTNATGPSNEGIVFDLSGYCTGDNDSINGTPGDSVNATSTALTAAQYDLQDTGTNGAITITNLAAGETATLVIYRDHDHASDDYGQDIGVIGFTINYYER